MSEPLIPLAPGDRVHHGVHIVRTGYVVEVATGQALVRFEDGRLKWARNNSLAYMPDEAEIERVRLELKRRHMVKRKLETHGCHNDSR